jgi:hypothetical protein
MYERNKKTVVLWIGIGLLVIFLFGGESIAGGFGWNYPE